MQKSTPQNVDEFMSECIHYNANILRDQTVLYIKNWVDNGILYIRHLVDSNENFLSLMNFENHYIRTSKKDTGIELNDSYKAIDTRVWSVIQRGNKHVQCVLSASGVAPTALRKWDERFNDLKWQNIFTLCFKSTPDVQLRWFQTRLLHRILPTNRYVYSQKTVDSPMCTFYGQEEETIRHLLWHCDISQMFWNGLTLLMDSKMYPCCKF